MFAFSTLAIAASFAAAVLADHGHNLHARSHHHVDRAGHHHKRDFTGQATYYAVGLGACGQYSKSTDFIVALNSAQYGGGYPGPHCFQSVRICKSGTDNCQNAVIMDECPTCAYGSLDMSESLFKAFASLDDGVFPITWNFSGGGGNDQTTTSKKPTPTSTKEPEPTTSYKPEPTTTWEPPTTTSTKEKTTTSEPPPEPTSTSESTTSWTSSTSTMTSTTEVTSSSSSSSSSSSVPTSTSTSSTYSSSTPSATATPSSSSSGSGGSYGGGSNLADANQIVLALGRLAVVARGGQ